MFCTECTYHPPSEFAADFHEYAYNHTVVRLDALEGTRHDQ